MFCTIKKWWSWMTLQVVAFRVFYYAPRVINYPSIMLLENIYSSDITLDNRHLWLPYYKEMPCSVLLKYDDHKWCFKLEPLEFSITLLESSIIHQSCSKRTFIVQVSLLMIVIYDCHIVRKCFVQYYKKMTIVNDASSWSL